MNKMKMIRWLGILAAAAISIAMAITTTIFRYRHPTLTETQLTQRCGLEYALMLAGAFVAAILISHRTTKE
jgi:hypothetical protein